MAEVTIKITGIGDGQIIARVVGGRIAAVIEGDVVDTQGRVWGHVGPQDVTELLTEEDLANLAEWDERRKLILMQMFESRNPAGLLASEPLRMGAAAEPVPVVQDLDDPLFAGMQLADRQRAEDALRERERRIADDVRRLAAARESGGTDGAAEHGERGGGRGDPGDEEAREGAPAAAKPARAPVRRSRRR